MDRSKVKEFKLRVQREAEYQHRLQEQLGTEALKLTNAQLAEQLGTTRRQVSKLKKEIRQQVL